jgi:SAM-dependent methyltransferase
MLLLDTLRGPSKSLRHRFVTGPLDVLRYQIVYRMAGRTRLDYWADRMDEAQASRLDHPFDPTYLANGAKQFEYLLAHGLRPVDRFLDYGCGPMRGGVHIAPYVSEGFYVGADISRMFMQRGVRLLEAAGIPRHSYHVVTIRDFDLTDLLGFRFSFGASFSALQYVEDADLKRILTAIRTLVHGPFYFDFPAPDRTTELAVKGQYYRSPDHVRSLCESVGFSAEIIPGYSEAPVARLTAR